MTDMRERAIAFVERAVENYRKSLLLGPAVTAESNAVRAAQEENLHVWEEILALIKGAPDDSAAVPVSRPQSWSSTSRAIEPDYYFMGVQLEYACGSREEWEKILRMLAAMSRRWGSRP